MFGQRLVIAILGSCIFLASAARADWPTWRGDASRSASSSDALPDKLHLQWVLQLSTPRPAWPAEQGKIQFDASYEPIVAEGRLIVPSMFRDCATAFRVSDGKEEWRFFANGPVRFAPVYFAGNVLFVSDDGYLYCLRASDGTLRWKFRGGPRDHHVLGNDRLVSMWPARGAPAVYDGKVYFAAGIWPFMGVFVHALDAKTGEVIWTNSGSGSNYLTQRLGCPAVAGVSPAAYLAVNEQVVLVSGGRTVPAAYDRKTGEFLFYRPGDRTLGKSAGGYELVLGDSWFANHGGLYALADGKPIAARQVDVLADDLMLGLASGRVTAATQITKREETKRNRFGILEKQVTFDIEEKWQAALPLSRLHLRAGETFVASDKRSTLGGCRFRAGPVLAEIWRVVDAGHIWTALASDGRLFVVPREGNIYSFGSEPGDTAQTANPADTARGADEPTSPRETVWKTDAERIAAVAGSPAGYAVVNGLADLAAVQELATNTAFHLIAFDRDADLCQSAREELFDAGLLGERIEVHHGDFANSGLPPYLANLIVHFGEPPADTRQLASLLRATHRSLRPYGGTAVLLQASDSIDQALKTIIAKGDFAEVEISRDKDVTVLRRAGPLPGAAPWTHHNGDSGNTLTSLDANVKAPLGLLWFGGPSHQGVLPRHGHGPTPQVIGGRLFLEGADMLRAVDVYTGRLLWQRELPGVGLYYDNTGHHAGAGAIGGNFASTDTGVFVAYGTKCLQLDPATGATVKQFALPPDASGKNPIFGYLSISDGRLIAGSSPMLPFTRSRAGDKSDELYSRFGEGSQRLVAFDIETQKVLWTRDAHYNFRHNAIAVGNGRVFCMDRMTEQRLAFLKRRGRVPAEPFTLLALDLETGDTIWETPEGVFGTWLSYSAQHDLLLQAGSSYRDRSRDEVGSGMTVYRGSDGEVLWHHEQSYGGPPMINGDKIITQRNAFELLTGKPLQKRDLLTGVEMPWKFTRNYGCNSAIGCTNLLTFRSAAAGYFDLQGNSGTGNLGGFRSSCTSNLIPADGVLSAPDYTRTCECSYQNQCSLALIHMPEAEMWTFQPDVWNGKAVQQLGINFGAPGDRRDEDGVLWLDYPSVGGRSPDVPVSVSGDISYSRAHATEIAEPDWNWVFASHLAGIREISITLDKDDTSTPRGYTIEFFVPASDEPATFAISIDGTVAIPRVTTDGTIHVVSDVAISDRVQIGFAPQAGVPLISGIRFQQTSD